MDAMDAGAITNAEIGLCLLYTSNTLDYKLYERIQQTIIETLDTCQWVEIKGCNGNETDLIIHLHELEDIKKQTNFENCVADVNIPVGEVFTSPVLAGTGGVLHVKKVYLNGLQFKDLKLSLIHIFITLWILLLRDSLLVWMHLLQLEVQDR